MVVTVLMVPLARMDLRETKVTKERKVNLEHKDQV